MRIFGSFGLILAVILIVYWWTQDHPSQPAAPVTGPVHSGSIDVDPDRVGSLGTMNVLTIA